VTVDGSDDDLRRGLAEMRERSALAEATYAALIQTGKLQSHLLLTYRCPQRCALLHVINLPRGAVFGWPRYKTSREETSRASSPDGRRKNTEGGEGKWKARAAFAIDVDDDEVGLTCDHLRPMGITKARIEADIAAGLADVVVRRPR